MPPVTVLLPIHQAGDSLPAAFSSIQGQTHRDLDILVILNGADRSTRSSAADLCRTESRARLIELPEANLPIALNRGLREARHELVARMDADDLCPPDRLAHQAAHLAEHPELAALGCAWEQRAPGNRLIATIRPATNPAELRWRLLIRNDLAHGSMLVRRSAVLAAGGYDQRRTRAQDYDLWLRLAPRGAVAALPEVLYTHTLRAGDGYSASALQAAHAAEVLIQAWSVLPPLQEEDRVRLAAALSQSISPSEGAPDPADSIGAFLTAHGPTREALLAWLCYQTVRPSVNLRAADACRRSRLREAGHALRTAGATRTWLWGAGSHTAFLLDHHSDLGLPIAGIIDDSVHGEKRFGFDVSPPGVLGAGEHALISSDAHEDAIWEQSKEHRARGVIVHRLYGAEPA